MIKQLLYSLLFCVPAVSFAQDILVKRDSSKAEAKILEVGLTEITYKYFNYQDGPTLIINKNEAAYIIYQNGARESFNLISEPVMPVYRSARDSVRKNSKVGDHIKFNIQVATVVYNSFCNAPRKNYSDRTSSDEYMRSSGKDNVTFNVGFNFLFGKNPYVKHILGANYLRTKGEFYCEHYNIGYSSVSKYTSYVSFINLVTGLRFTCFKKLHLEPIISVNFIRNSKTTRTGTKSITDMSTYVVTQSSYQNEPAHTFVQPTVSFSPKISYEILSKKIKLEAYISYNLALYYRLPWYQFGFHIFPFKKLR